MATKTALIPLAAMMAGGRAVLPYAQRLELHKARLAGGVATDWAMWVHSVALARQKPAQRGLTLPQMVIELAAEGTLEKFLPFLPCDDDRLTAREIAAGDHPTTRYLATLAYGYAYLSPAEQQKVHQKVRYYLTIENPEKERECYNKLCDLNPAMAAVLRMRWRRANGLPDEDDLPVTAEEKLAAMMGRALEAGGGPRRVAAPLGANDPWAGVAFGAVMDNDEEEAFAL